MLYHPEVAFTRYAGNFTGKRSMRSGLFDDEIYIRIHRYIYKSILLSIYLSERKIVREM